MMSCDIQDDFLPLEDFEYIRDTLLSPYFPWFYNDYSVASSADNNPQLVHIFARSDGIPMGIPSSDYFEMLNPIFNRIENLCTLARCKANLTLGTHENIESGYHVDLDKKFVGKTSVFYLQNTNGQTKFKNGEVVDCVANRLITFDNDIEHTGTTCTDNNRRVVINFNYTVWHGHNSQPTPTMR